MLGTGHALLAARLVECGQHSANDGSRRCEEQFQASIGVFLLVALVVLVLVVMHVRRRARRDGVEAGPRVRLGRGFLASWREWREWRRQEAREGEAARQRLLQEYVEAYDAGDPDLRRVSRDFYDNDHGFPWIAQVGIAAYLLGLIVSVTLLVLLFEGIKHLTQ